MHSFFNREIEAHYIELKEQKENLVEIIEPKPDQSQALVERLQKIRHALVSSKQVCNRLYPPQKRRRLITKDVLSALIMGGLTYAMYYLIEGSLTSSAECNEVFAPYQNTLRYQNQTCENLFKPYYPHTEDGIPSFVLLCEQEKSQNDIPREIFNACIDLFKMACSACESGMGFLTAMIGFAALIILAYIGYMRQKDLKLNWHNVLSNEDNDFLLENRIFLDRTSFSQSLNALDEKIMLINDIIRVRQTIPLNNDLWSVVGNYLNENDYRDKDAQIGVQLMRR